MLPAHIPEIPAAEQLFRLAVFAIAVVAIVAAYMAVRVHWPHPRRRRP